jgi:hypothetical protein
MMAKETVTMMSSVGMSAAMRRNASFSMRGLYHLSRQAQFPALAASCAIRQCRGASRQQPPASAAILPVPSPRRAT